MHFLLIFALVAILAAQNALIRPGITVSDLRLAATLDRVYGISAVLLLGVGFARVLWGTKGSPFYLSNPLFWTKLGFFMAVAIISIPPTLRLIQWSKHIHSFKKTNIPLVYPAHTWYRRGIIILQFTIYRGRRIFSANGASIKGSVRANRNRPSVAYGRLGSLSLHINWVRPQM